jgi:hypothetical protein
MDFGCTPHHLRRVYVRNMAKKWLVVGIAVLGFASAKINVATDGAVYAADARASNPYASDAMQLSADAQCVSTVPRSWGEYRGGSNQAGLAFEASDGTLRFVTNLPCGAVPVIALEVRRTTGSRN